MELILSEIKKLFLVCAIPLGILCSCETPIVSTQPNLTIAFEHHVEDKAIVLDTQFYFNAANNRYRLQEIKYFISSLQLHKNDGTKIEIKQNEGIHYVDMSFSSTLTWDIFQNIPEGLYDSISFIFGLNEMDNQSFRFKNTPESNMAWTQVLGGGYHYMMLNGWFFRGDTVETPLNIHLGRGQIYQGETHNTDSIIAFVDNYFYVNLKKSFWVKSNKPTALTIVMNINNWFDDPFLYDFNYWGSHIMQNQAAMNAIKENGHDAFLLMIND